MASLSTAMPAWHIQSEKGFKRYRAPRATSVVATFSCYDRVGCGGAWYTPGYTHNLRVCSEHRVASEGAHHSFALVGFRPDARPARRVHGRARKWGARVWNQHRLPHSALVRQGSFHHRRAQRAPGETFRTGCYPGIIREYTGFKMLVVSQGVTGF
eukprot:1186219-Prorocentrum_minimum.AAC.3